MSEIKVDRVIDARKVSEGGQVLKIDNPPQGPVTAVFYNPGPGGSLLIAFDRSILKIERASKQQARSFSPADSSKFTEAYLIGTGIWNGPEAFKGNDIEPGPTIAAALIGCELVEIKAFDHGVSIDFGNHLLLLTAGKISLASMDGVFPNQDTAEQC